jgi:Fe-S cluster biosynthesis and repair protein YggX
MSQVTCARCGQQAPGLAQAPMSGQLGQDLLTGVCQGCWKEWTQESYRIINHYGLQPVDPVDREKLRGFMREYFKLA